MNSEIKYKIFSIIGYEVWKDVGIIRGINFTGKYQVSNLGRVKSIEFRNNICVVKRDKILRISHYTNGYCFTSLSNNKKVQISIHRLVGKLFLEECKDKNEINHLDGNKDNNCLYNIERSNRSLNGIHKFRVLGCKQWNTGILGKNNILSLKFYQYSIEGKYLDTHIGISETERKLGYCKGTISNALNGKSRTSYGFIWKFTKT